MEAFDIITVGSGHNALVAAALLEGPETVFWYWNGTKTRRVCVYRRGYPTRVQA